MATLSKEDVAKIEVALLAEEQATKKKWCALRGHKWDLPGSNPLNTDTLECPLRCNRCNGTAILTITIDKESK